MLAKLSSLIAGTLAVYPTGPTDYGWNGGCMTLPASRWQAGVVSQWRNADTARPNPKSWHAEQMKLYLDLHDEANEGSTKYDDYAYVDDTYFELVFDVNLFNLGATFNPFYPVQLDQTFTKADGTTATQGLWYSTEGCCTLHVEVDDKEQGRDLLDGSISNDYLEWQWTNHPGTWFTYADHIIEVRMCQHPSTTNNGYDTWFNGPSTVDATHVGAAETSGCTVLDCASDFRWVTHWDGQSSCCNAVDAPYTTRTGQIAIDGDFGPLNQGDFFEIALDGQLFDINEINGGNFVTVENIQDNAYRFFVDTDSFNGQRQFNLDTMRFEKSGGTGIFANYQLYFIGANSFVKPECKWIQLCRAGAAETTTAAVTTTAAPPCSDPAACDPTWGTCVVVTDSGGVDHEDCQCAADYQGEQCQSLCPLADQDKVDLSFVINMAGADNNGLSGHITDFVKDTLKMYDTNNNVRVSLTTCGGVSHYTEWITTPEHRTNADWEATFSSVLSSGFTGANAADCSQAVYKAEAALDITDDIPDVMILISDGEDLNTVSLSGAVDSVKNNHVTLMAVGYPDEGTSSSDGTELTVLAGGDAANCFNCGTSDHITGNVDFTSIFNIICNAPPPPDVCDNNGGCVNGVCSRFTAPDGMEHADCQCDSGFQGEICDEPCALPGPDDRVDVVFLLDYSGAVVDPNVHVQPKDLIDQLVRDFDTLGKVKIGLVNYASTANVEIGPVQHMSPEHSDPIIWGQAWPNDPITNTPTAIQIAAQQFDTTDAIPDMLIIVTDGHIEPALEFALPLAMDQITADGIETYVIGIGHDGVSDADNLLIMAQGNADQMVNAGTSDNIGWSGPVREAIQTGAFNAICGAEVVTTTTPVTTATTITPPTVVNELEAGVCYSGNWTKWMDLDNPGDGDDAELFVDALAGGNVECAEIAAIQVRDIANPDALQAADDLIMNAQTGMICNEADQLDASCEDYEVRFCCEGCCPLLNISGDPELTDYYEDYPGLYELTDEVFNEAIVYRQIAGYDAAGVVIYGQGVVYYWMDVGWLLGPNTFTYSYYSDGIGEKCPQHAPKNWTNEVFGTQLTVECLPVYPSCNDVECVENACCVMSDDGPICTCEDGYTLYEDGSCLKEETKDDFSDGYCDTAGDNGPAMVWTDWTSIDAPLLHNNDYETLQKYPQNQICASPAAIEAQRITAGTGTPLIVHISKELGFWCDASEQTGGVPCEDFQVRFCCPKYEAGDTLKCDTGDGYAWTKWSSADTPATGAGDWETISYFGERDVCSSPVAVKAQPVAGSTGSDAVTHIDPLKGFWCTNEEQGGTDDCMDFEVQFCCPKPVTDDVGMTYVMDGTCDDPTYGWSQYMNSDSPLTDDGDWETLGAFARKYTCENPSGIQARTNETTGFDRVHLNVESGFWCLNSEQVGGQCADFEVRFCCPQYKTADCTAPGSSWTGWYNDEWDKKNEKIWVSSREERETLQMYGDGAACSAPTAAEIRPRPTGSVSFQTTMWDYSTKLVDHLSTTEYLCINEEQGIDEFGDPYKCIDMEIRFCCASQLTDGDCDGDGLEWTEYMNIDTDQTDTGDFELISGFTASGVCGNPAAIQARSTAGNTDFTHISKELGFYCVNGEQDDGSCDDYEVRFCCPKYQVGECNLQGYAWSSWIDNDDPTDLGDMENFSALQPNTACQSPIAIKAKDNNAHFLDSTSDQVTHLDMSGFYCFNHEQTNGLPCSDFSVAYCCPTDEEPLTCGSSGVCPENEWCLETALGPQCYCGDDDFNVDWDEDDYVEYEDGTCLHNNSSSVVCDGTDCKIEVGSCDTYGYAWSTLNSVSDPTGGDGDYEFIHAHPRGCDNPTGLRAVAADDGSSTWPVHIELGLGFWCVNSEQGDGQCADFSVQMCCPVFATGECNAAGYKWSEYVNNDLPDGIGDWESLPATVCANPTAIEASLSANATEPVTQKIHLDNDQGMWCLNDENAGACSDYAIRMCCPEFTEGECESYGYTMGNWLDSDDPDGQGDLELNSNHGSHVVCDAPEAITARQINQTEVASNATTRISVSEGFVCLNDAFNTCNDYEVSYCCPKWADGNVHCNVQGYAWTEWINQDDPTSSPSSGDWETRTSYGERMVCSSPIGVQATPIDENVGSTEVTHIDASLGFWCVNEEQPNGAGCADFAVRFCCPQYQIGDDVSCDTDGYEWTDWLDRDDPTGDGDYETISDYALENACDAPTAIDARARSSGSTAVTHIDLAYGFWCNNDEQSVESGGCADFEVRYCCPKKAEKECNVDGHRWTVWMDRDDPDQGTGDWENRDGFPANVVCQTPLALQAQVKSGSVGSDEVTHFDNEQGFWCINGEQPKDRQCADFEVRFCCPDEYFDPCVSYNLTCGSNEHEVFQILADGSEQCSCLCDEGYLFDVATSTCLLDVSCDATLDSCPDFDTCINKNGALTTLSRQNCNDTVCTTCTDGVDCAADPSKGTDGVEIECADPSAYPALNGGDKGTIACVCDGKNPCTWQSDDFLGDITEDDLCITNTDCPIPSDYYPGDIQIVSQRFLTDVDHADTDFNTRQSDLYDNGMTEILGRIDSAGFDSMAAHERDNWLQGHYLVIVWEADMRETVDVCPYGDYYDRVESDYGDGDVEVFETFVDPFVLRDSSNRDNTGGMDVVLNVRHDYDLDVEDIMDLLNFRIFMVPKQWHDSYGDIIKKTSQEVADCLNQVLDNTAKLNGQTRHLLQGKLAEQTPKWKKRISDGDKKFRSPSQKGQTWRQRNKAKQLTSTVVRS